MKKNNLLLLVLLTIITLFTFHKTLQFGMWIDDQKLIWASLYDIKSSLPYYNHPGLPLTFLVLSRLFKEHYFLWQLFGLSLKIFGAFLLGNFVYEITQSKKAKIVSSILFATSYIGFEAIAAPIMNISAVVTLPMLLALIYLTRSITQNLQYIKGFLLFFILSLFLDPGRMLSCLFMLPFFILLFPDSKLKRKVISFATISILVISIVSFPFLVVWFFLYVQHSQIVIGLTGLVTQTSDFLPKINRIMNLFAAVGNMFIGLVIPMSQNEQNTGVYNRLFGYSGVIVWIAGIIFLIHSLQTKSKRSSIISFFILWTFIWYIPNWFSEPRAPMAGPHRYLYISSIGLVSLISYLLSLIKRKRIVILYVFLIMSANIVKAHTLLTWQSSYRDKQVTERIWKHIESETQDNLSYIFIVTGHQPWLSQNIILFGGDRYLLRKKIADPTFMPLITTDASQIIASLCQTNIPNPLTRIRGWEVQSPGILTSTTEYWKAYYKNQLDQVNCQLFK